MTKNICILLTSIFLLSCNTKNEVVSAEVQESEQDALLEKFQGLIDLNDLPDYENQEIPNYITKDNTGDNPVTNKGAVLGRVLFYDVNLSSNNTISCGSCHKQSMAFGDDNVASLGVNGSTARHSMRLVNARFAEEQHFFWDERADNLEEQTTQPIQDHIEMGFSGENGDETLNDLTEKLAAIEYYKELFTFVYGDASVTEARMQSSLAQFVRSIQSFDSKFDQGRSQVNNDNDNFPNFTAQENDGKDLFIRRPNLDNNSVRTGGGVGCNACHQAPEFDIDANSDNNGLISTISGLGSDTEVTRSPTLRDLFNAQGLANGPFMHDGFSSDFMDVLDHYDQIDGNGNNNLDRRLRPNGNDQNLAMTQEEKNAILAFVKTLSGTNVYTDERWSDPFEGLN